VDQFIAERERFWSRVLEEVVACSRCIGIHGSTTRRVGGKKQKQAGGKAVGRIAAPPRPNIWDNVVRPTGKPRGKTRKGSLRQEGGVGGFTCQKRE